MPSVLGVRLAELRKQHKMSGQKLADQLGITQSYISYIENKDNPSPNIDLVNKMAKIFNVTTDYLTGASDSPTAESTEKDEYTQLRASDRDDMRPRPFEHAENSTQPSRSNGQSQTRSMIDELMMRMARENPDLIIHFRDLQKNLDKLTPGDIQALADAYAHITSKANEEIERRLKKSSRHGDI